MAKAHWHSLIRHLKALGEITTGLTIPYLYGAYKRLGYQFDSIEELLMIILNSPAKEIAIIEKCDLIKFDVLKFEDRHLAKKNRKKEIKILGDQSARELIISYNTALGSDLKEVASSLVALYQAPIDRKTFSWNNKETRWQQFNESDLKSIDSIK